MGRKGADGDVGGEGESGEKVKASAVDLMTKRFV